MRFKGPLAGSYAAAAALVVFCLVPFLMLSAAVVPLAQLLGKSLGLPALTLDVVLSVSYAAYAVGTVLAVQFAAHRPQRRMLVVYVSLFLIAAVLTAWSPSAWVFVVGFIVEALCTSLMLIAAVPPLVTGWPPSKMPFTGAIMNLCVFGAVAAGPSIGSFEAADHIWRPLFWAVALIAALAVAFALLTYEDVPPQDTSAPRDFMALSLAATGCLAAFFGAGYLQGSQSASFIDVVPLVSGAVLVVTLVVYQYRSTDPLMPVKQLATTLPAMGVLVAMFSSAASFGLMELVLTALAKQGPVAVGLWFLPEFGGAIVMAGIFAVAFRSRYTPVLAIGGLGLLAAAAGIFTFSGTRGGAWVAAGNGLLGLAVGASVSPALFIAGFSLKSSQVQRVFALIELLRGVTAFLIAPVLAFLVGVFSTSKVIGTTDAIWVCFGLATLGGLLALALFTSGGSGLQVPDLAKWGEGGELAWSSPPLFALRRHAVDAANAVPVGRQDARLTPSGRQARPFLATSTCHGGRSHHDKN
jgi:MFS family permease